MPSLASANVRTFAQLATSWPCTDSRYDTPTPESRSSGAPIVRPSSYSLPIAPFRLPAEVPGNSEHVTEAVVPLPAGARRKLVAKDDETRHLMAVRKGTRGLLASLWGAGVEVRAEAGRLDDHRADALAAVRVEARIEHDDGAVEHALDLVAPSGSEVVGERRRGLGGARLVAVDAVAHPSDARLAGNQGG